jgi:hypothetical protein
LDTDVTDAAAEDGPARPTRLRPGTKVEVRNRFDGAWTRGFEVVEVVKEGYRLARLSDGSVLPVTFAADDVRRERRRETWWV